HDRECTGEWDSVVETLRSIFEEQLVENTVAPAHYPLIARRVGKSESRRHLSLIAVVESLADPILSLDFEHGVLHAFRDIQVGHVIAPFRGGKVVLVAKSQV